MKIRRVLAVLTAGLLLNVFDCGGLPARATQTPPPHKLTYYTHTATVPCPAGSSPLLFVARFARDTVTDSRTLTSVSVDDTGAWGCVFTDLYAVEFHGTKRSTSCTVVDPDDPGMAWAACATPGAAWGSRWTISAWINTDNGGPVRINA